MMKTRDLKRVLAFLKAGKVVVFPTDTVYGLLADATNKKAVAKVFVIKKRPTTKPLPVFVDTIARAKKIAFISRTHKAYLKRRWPGPFTAVLDRKKGGQPLYGVASKTIALRIPNVPKIRLLIRQLKRPLVATSANIAGKPSCRTLEEVKKQFARQKTKPDIFVDGGTLPGTPSQVIDMTTSTYIVLRSL
ncbi:MAG: threonylcarbamoyl-AMP synthase [Parcubacteria group bacterium]|nr:threonylcarbamoyl-AMP synthase [Parcubacteria group bacterium]